MQNPDTIKILHRHAGPWRLLSGEHRGTWLSTIEINQLIANPNSKHAIKHTQGKLAELRTMGLVQSRREGNRLIWCISDHGATADVSIVPRMCTDEQRAKWRLGHARMMAIRAAKAAAAQGKAPPPPPQTIQAPEPRGAWEDQMPTQRVVRAADAPKLAVNLALRSVFEIGFSCAQ